MSTTTLPPGPRQRFPGQNLLRFRRDAIGFLRRLAHDYGDIVSFRLTGPPMTLLSHPDHIRDVLVTHARGFAKGRGLERSKRLLGEGLLTSEGDFHRHQRRLIQPAFHRRRIETYGLVMADCAEQVSDRWQDGQTVDMSAEMMRLTLAIVGRTLFDTHIEAEAGEIGAALSEAIHLFHVLMLPGAETLEKLPLPFVRRFREARARLDAVIYRLIAEHRASGEDRGDLLSMLLSAQDEDQSRMTDAQVRDEAMTLFLAGHDTTANALTWTWFLLSENPAVAATLHAELDAALLDRTPTVDDLPRLPYTRAVLAESMRLYPPAWIIGRRALADYPVGGYVVPQGSIVILAQVVTHTDPRWFPDPLRFDPSRWTTGEAQAARPNAYFPFGGGPRICIGEQFAWMEGTLLYWRPSPAAGTPASSPAIPSPPSRSSPSALNTGCG